jgi:hypothetical protein
VCNLWLQRTTDFARRDETRQRLTEQERQERNQQLQKTLTLLVHACSCHDPQCSSTSCRKVRQNSPCEHFSLWYHWFLVVPACRAPGKTNLPGSMR